MRAIASELQQLGFTDSKAFCARLNVVLFLTVQPLRGQKRLVNASAFFLAVRVHAYFCRLSDGICIMCLQLLSLEDSFLSFSFVVLLSFSFPFFSVFGKVCFTQLTCVGHVPITVRAKINMVKGKLFISVDHISAPSDVLWRYIRQRLSVRAIVASELQQLGFTDSKSTVQRRMATMQRQSCIVSSVLKKKAKLLDQRTERRIRDWIRNEGSVGKMQVLKRLRELGYTVSYRTVRRTLKSLQYI